MNVRFFAGSKADYLSLPSPRNPLGLYFCEDTKELYWADRLLTDGIRVVPTFADLPTRADAIADGVVYYVTETRNGYVISPDRTQWLQTIYAPAIDAYKVPESEIYNTVTTVGAVRDIEAKIYKTIDERIADIEIGTSGSGVTAIYFAGRKLDAHDDGSYHIDRLCALRALGFDIPDDFSENTKIEFVTKEYVDEQIKAVSGIDLKEYAKQADLDQLSEIISNIKVPTKVSDLENDNNYITNQDLDHLATKEDLSEVAAKIPSIEGLASEKFVLDQISDIKHPTVDLNGYATEDYLKVVATTNKYEVLPIDGMLISYRGDEVRLNTQRVIPVQQDVGPTGNPNTFNVTFRAYAPVGAAKVIEGSIDGNTGILKKDEEFSTLATDSYGRKYTTIWAAIAMKTGDGWLDYGSMSTADKYVGHRFTFDWYDENDNIIGADRFNVVLTNDTCHYEAVSDAIARKINDKVTTVNNTINNLVENITENYTTNTDLAATYVTNNEITEVVNQAVTNNIEDKITTIIDQKVTDGEIQVKVDSITYGTF